MDSDTYAHARSQSLGAEDTIGHIEAHLSQVITSFISLVSSHLFHQSILTLSFYQAHAYITHLGRMTSSANTSKTMVNSLERKCANLESTVFEVLRLGII